jgi:hypothetical protein
MKKLGHFILISSFLYLIILGGELVALQKRDMRRLGKMLKIQPPPGAIELELVYSFPTKEQEEQDQYFWDPYGIASDPTGNIFVVDYSNTVFKYDSAGEFIKKFGRSGQGPGDLLKPLQILTTKDSIVVAEAGNMRLQFFDFEGRYIKNIKIIRWYESLAINEGGLIFGAPLLRRGQAEPKLIDVLSKEGKLLYSFGELLNYKYDRDHLNRTFLSLNRKGELLVVFEFFPIVRKYSQKGILVAEYHIETEMMAEKEKYNKELYSYRPQERVSYIQVIHRAEEFGNHLFMLDYVPPRIYIMEMNEEGKLENTYWANVGEKYFAFDILPKKEKNRMMFYVLQRNPEAKINIFALKN